MRKALILLAVAATLAACGSEPSPERERDSSSRPAQAGPGDAAVYDRIAAATDCGVLQQEFDTASANNERAEAGSDQAEWTLAYMKAADERMKALDCY